jgi:hypothetical protein
MQQKLIALPKTTEQTKNSQQLVVSVKYNFPVFPLDPTKNQQLPEQTEIIPRWV